MKYLTGIHALNLPCSLDTCGDWHSKSINWNNPDIRESSSSALKDYGIEKERSVTFLKDHSYNVANHIRALLDMLLIGNYGYAQGMKEEYICNDSYTEEIFKQVLKLKNEKNWDDIDEFMKKEYKMKWIEYSHNDKIISNNHFSSCDKTDLELENNVVNLFQMKINDYNRKDNIRDLYDIIFIMKNYKEQIPDILIDQLKNSFEYKGLEHLDYLIKNQSELYIDKGKLVIDLLELFDMLGLSDDFIEEIITGTGK